MLRFRSDPDGRRILLLVIIGTIPAVAGLFLEGTLDTFQDTVSNVGWALIGTGVILLLGQRFARGIRRLEEGRVPDAALVGLAQAFALIPGISRSGSTITAGNMRGFEPSQAARYSFLLGIPIAGAGLLQIPDLAGAGRLDAALGVGFLTAALSGYLAISLPLAVIKRVGLVPFAVYALRRRGTHGGVPLMADRNVLGEPLEPCSVDPLTGWFRDGSCRTGRTTWGVTRSARS